MSRQRIIHRIEACPQCGFRFRGRVETYMHPSLLARRVQMGMIWIMFPALAGVAAFIALTRDERGQMISFAGDKNLIMLLMFTPTLLMYGWFVLLPKQVTYRCPQCSWQVSYSSRDKPQVSVSESGASNGDSP
jgi:DNA-directed RNA polymerase subunit RPC12/RpoP